MKEREDVAAAVALIYETLFAPNPWRGLSERNTTGDSSATALSTGSLQSVMPFLERALASATEKTVTDAAAPPQARLLGDLPLAVCIVSRGLRLVSATRKADELLRGDSALSVLDGNVHAVGRELRGQLAERVVSAIDRGQTSTFGCSGSPGASQLFLAGPIALEDGEHAAVLFLNIELGVFDRLATSLMDVYGLTRSEAEVTSRLAQGLSINGIAAAKHLSVNTVRTQVKSVFSKTGTARQGELVSLVLNGPAVWLRLVNMNTEPRPVELGAASDVLHLEDGRALSYADYGPADGEAVFLFHHLLGSRAEGPGDEALLRRLNIRLIVPDRPGIGMSTPVAKRRLVDWPGDVRELADHLSIPRFHVLGFSTGGPHAAACAALLENRVLSLGLVASLMPMDELPAGTTATLTQRFLTGISRHWPTGARKLLELRYQKLLENPDDNTIDMNGQADGADAALLRDPEILRIFLDVRKAAAAVPKRVYASELVALSQPWGFRLAEIRTPVRMWHGRQDEFFAVEHAEAMSSQISDCDAVFENEWGHFFLYREWERVLADFVR